jgi:high affinity Mn2+ porin
MKEYLPISVILFTLGSCHAAIAADASAPMPVKVLPSSFYDWSGFYVGAHVGYMTGSSDWAAQNTATPESAVIGTTDLFSRAGGLIGGFQAGYNHMFPSRVMLGFETDVTFPNYVNGSQSFATPAIGQANSSELVEFAGTVRGRAGYAFDRWLVYGTGGFAFAYDELSRTQDIGTPNGAVAVPGTVESQFLGRLGWTAGAGIEYGFAPNWSAKAEYLFSDYGSHSNFYPQGGQRFDSDLALQEFRLGLNYRPFDDDANSNGRLAMPSTPAIDNWIFHAQTTFTEQYAAPFHAPVVGPNSLESNAGRETWDASLFVGLRLWDGAEVWVDPEIDQGFGLSNTLGVAGFTSGEAYKVGFSYPYFRIPRAYLRQTFDLGGAPEKVDADLNQFAATHTANEVVITVGKFGVPDIFDTNKYAHDPHNDFLNWSLVDAGTWDYAADAWGWTYGGAVEWYQDRFTLRGGFFDLSEVPNSTNLDNAFQQFQWDGEIEERHEIFGQPGKFKITGFLNRGRMGSFQDAINLAELTGEPADITEVRHYQSRPGISVNLEQQLNEDLGLFARAGSANGQVEPYEFTDIDQTMSGGFSLAGKQWGRPDDTVGIAGVVNSISAVHEAFLNDGGLGILIGDGQLPHPGPEQILETYYSYALPQSWKITFDYQYIVNPGYNRDRGPVSVLGTRLHWQF